MLTPQEHDRIAEAYVRMAREVKYRPYAPGDGMGTIELTDEELRDPLRLQHEAHRYAVAFIREEDSLQFFIGCSNFETNRALVYTIEAARLLCCGMADKPALKLLQMAIAEVKPVIEKRTLPKGILCLPEL